MTPTIETFRAAAARRRRLLPLLQTAEAALEDALDATKDVAVMDERLQVENELRLLRRTIRRCELGIREADRAVGERERLHSV